MECSLTVNQFWHGISIFLTNYHVINRKIFGCLIQKIIGVEKTRDVHCELKKICINHKEYSKLELETYLMKYDQIKIRPEIFIVHLKLLCKKRDAFVEATGCIDFINTSYVLKFNANHLDDFLVQLREEQLEMYVLSKNGGDKIKCSNWLEYAFKPKFLKWCSSYKGLEISLQHKNKMIKSLNLIDMEKYNELYKLLKLKYSKLALKFWQEAKESTDPLKYIYEDLAIATYLITLWRSDMIKDTPATFADLGCGNGLLVYVLNEEGYLGYGYDLRKRKIWRLYPEHISSKLFEQAIVPDNFALNNKVNWLIGNHSDELSPWLPVLASKMDYNTSYFLLPCCAFEFSGVKFQRRNSSKSVYNDFCDYVENISNVCGYVTFKDRLKIPSTKRIAFIGITRGYSSCEFSIKSKEIESFVQNEMGNQIACDNISKVNRVQLRRKEDSVKNCTQIDRSLMNALVKKIFTLLLNFNVNDDCVENDSVWRVGSVLTLKMIVQHLNKEELSIIKSESGGLKTLLLNHHEIFIFLPDNKVKIRKPEIKPETQRIPIVMIKKRRCFFYDNHPQRCPLSNAMCTFIH